MKRPNRPTPTAADDILFVSISKQTNFKFFIHQSDSGCDNINGLILLSPVDGLDPYGFLDYYCIVPGEKLNFETPTLLISAGYDNVPGQ